MTATEKMLSGKIYDTSDPKLADERVAAHRLCQQYNNLGEEEVDQRNAILNELLPNHQEGTFIQGPMYFDYGKYTATGKNFYANFNFTVLDSGPIKIGDDVLIGPNVTLVTPVHPLRFQERNIKVNANGTQYDDEYAKPITIGNNCWLASNVTVVGGVTIGDGCVIGAGSVVTRDIPANSLAVGNPCKVIRAITEKDDIHLKKDLF
ncbi:sugar O-acetyltransferase [Lentilactobacillus kisonensis]|uniref:Acetyltransferase n=2 Tax=Lentilactobacillus kisonensis TaxID=481722 RepID=H1LIA0_9LACO|nr:sugar O-acetyltransferase [Lentilactobacillus kisonensis]EHO49933.1 putative maltose O-acetyltransferase [Lentilactobacillus kisonensis F0435]KRL22110.1 maltose O-acetyltransferase [Lentilactobacillus kisonensis DSM 19906 = JCM 15041]